MQNEASIPELSYAQQRLWFLDQLAPGSAAYNMSAALWMRGTLYPTVLEETLGEIARRHEVLRSTIAVIDGEPVQVIHSTEPFRIPVIELGQVPDAEDEAMRLVQEEADRPFDLERGPLLRVTLLRLGANEHVLLVTMHHIISDGWSVGVLIKEIGAIYSAYLTEEPSLPPELPIQYADFARWQRQWLTGEVVERELSYWKEQLRGTSALLELPADRPRPAVQSYSGAREMFEFSPRLLQGLQLLSRRESVTLFMTLMAAFQAQLWRYTQQDDVIVATPISGRTHAEVENLIGFFVNTLILRTDLSGNPSFTELLQRVRRVSLAAYAHQNVPFERLVEELGVERDLSRSPLFQVMMVWQNARDVELELPGLKLNFMPTYSSTAKFDLMLSLEESPAGLRGMLEYSTNLFDRARIVRMIGHFETLLEGIVAHPEQRLSDLPLLTAVERRQLLLELNKTAQPVSQKTLAELFEAQVEQSGQAMAVVAEGEELSYEELNRRANQLAHWLRKQGVGPEVPVAVCLERSVEMLVGVLGVLKAGGAYVPLDPDYPTERMKYLLEAAGVKVLLTQERLRKVLPAAAVEVVYLDTGSTKIAQQPVEAVANRASSENLAYVIYTSGSTGVPKGVGCTHGAVVNMLADAQRRKSLTVGHRCSFWTNLSFDVSVYEIFSALLVGATLHIVPEQIRADSRAFILWLHEKQIEGAYIPGFMLADVLQSVRENSASLPLRRLLVGVEPIEEEVLRAIQESIGGLQILNNYGPTEATVYVTSYEVREQGEGRRRAPIGRPIQNTSMYLLDKQQEPV